MPINAKRAADRIVSKLESMGIDEHVGGRESHTAELVREIVAAIMDEIVNNGEVIIVNLPVQTSGSPGFHTGFGNGKGDII